MAKEANVLSIERSSFVSFPIKISEQFTPTYSPLIISILYHYVKTDASIVSGYFICNYRRDSLQIAGKSQRTNSSN